MALGDLLRLASDGLTFGALLALATAYVVYVGIWRLCFSPISHIPGPKLAALTWGYEMFYDLVLGGQYTFAIIDMHKKYGPIVRINPEEVHVGDPDFHSELYAGSHRRREPWSFFTKQFGADESVLATIDHHLHRLRRAAIGPFFSTQSVRNLQGVIEERVNALLRRLLHYSRTSSDPLDLMYAFSAFTHDVIYEYSFAKSHHAVEDATFGKAFTDSMLKGTHYGKFVQHAEILLKAVNALPDFLSAALVPGWRAFLQTKREIRHQIGEIKATENTEKWALDVQHPTIFHTLLSSKTLPSREKSVTRLAQDGQILVQGGTLTTSWTLALGCFHLLSSTPALSRLRTELATAMPDPHAAVTGLAELERLPQLRAVVKESLRLSLGTSGRLTRVCPDEDLVYTDPATGTVFSLPAGTAISMTTYKTVMDPVLFPDPLGFHPERWLHDEVEGRLDRYLTVFGRGSRACLGMALAQAELSLMLAKLWRVWGSPEVRADGDVGVLRVFETTARDCEMASDYFIPMPWKRSKGIRVTLEPSEA